VKLCERREHCILMTVKLSLLSRATRRRKRLPRTRHLPFCLEEHYHKRCGFHYLTTSYGGHYRFGAFYTIHYPHHPPVLYRIYAWFCLLLFAGRSTAILPLGGRCCWSKRYAWMAGQRRLFYPGHANHPGLSAATRNTALLLYTSSLLSSTVLLTTFGCRL